MKRGAILPLCLLLFACASDPALTRRSDAARREFVKLSPCPSTGAPKLPCPDYQIDHVKPLKCGGADHPDNMQWLTVAEHKEKTRLEAKMCRRAVRL